MDKYVLNPENWKNKKVLVTGHTGFKGSWLVLWLLSMGSKVWGYSLNPPTEPNLYEVLNIKNSLYGEWIKDIRDFESIQSAINVVEPDVIFHLAAQPLVRESYRNPIETYAVNVMGTINLLEAARNSKSIRAIVNVTTDKCYDNKEWFWGYREDEALGGYDPYSSSKACSELVTSAYRNSFFNPSNYDKHGVAIATARAGNVIGGGDWAIDRLIPDCIKSLTQNKQIVVRNPNSIRPWQHVLEPLGGYLLLAEQLMENGSIYSEAWNFGPLDHDSKTVEWIVERLCDKWGSNNGFRVEKNEDSPHEAKYLKLDCSKASTLLGWNPKWSLDTALDKIVYWNKQFAQNPNGIVDVTLKQINEYNNGIL